VELAGGYVMRKEPLRPGEVYHVFNKSISDFRVFGQIKDAARMVELIRYYRVYKPDSKYSYYLKSTISAEKVDSRKDNNDFIVEIVAYCVMPTHLHLILKEVKAGGISVFMNKILNAYSRYFNIKYNRKGPLWERRFQNVLCENDEQLLHLTRYVHLNPVTAQIVEKPELWEFSSYREYVAEKTLSEDKEQVCVFRGILDMDSKSYKKFVEDRIAYQRTLAEIKQLIIE
jgi:putative transposase